MFLTHGADCSLGLPQSSCSHCESSILPSIERYHLLLLPAREEGFSHLGTYVSELVLFV